jgi:hypothetical protein
VRVRIEPRIWVIRSTGRALSAADFLIASGLGAS